MMMPDQPLDRFNASSFSPIPLFTERVSAYWIPLIIPITVIGAVQLSGKLRTFAEPGDGLFLHRMVRWARVLTVMGFAYGALARLVISSLFVGVLAPLLLQVYALSAASIVMVGVYSASSACVWMLLKDAMMRRWSGWQRTVMQFIMASACLYVFVWTTELGVRTPSWLGLATLLLSAVSGWLLVLRMRARGTFMHEVGVENAAYVASVSWILMETIDKKPVPKLKRPFLFSRSKPLIKHRDDTHRLLDSFVKSVLRRVDLLRPNLIFIGVGIAAVVMTPLFLAGVVWLVLPMLLMGWLQRQWLQWLSEPYLSLFKWDEDKLQGASIKARIWGTFPPFALWGVIIGIRLGLAYGSIS
jgi:ABC-2 type transport system permease protein